jgi:hypothetical protein
MREPSAILPVSLAEADCRAPLRFARNDNCVIARRSCRRSNLSLLEVGCERLEVRI